MANINTPVVTALTTESGQVVRKNEYRGNPQKIPFFLDNGTLGINNADTITFTTPLPQNCVAVSVHLKTAGVGASTTLTFSAGGTNISGAIATSSAIDNAYLFTLAGEDTVDVSGETIIATVGGADWDDGANDVWGYIEIITDE
jgi:hypothetical protein